MNMLQFYEENVHPLHDFYREMERTGIAIDKDKRETHISQSKSKLQIYQSELDEIAGTSINCNSPKQVALYLFSSVDKGGLGIKVREDVGEDTLNAVINNSPESKRNPLIKRALTLILQIRKEHKHLNTYLMAKTGEDGRMHTNVKISGTETFRTSNTILKAPLVIVKEGMAFQTITKHGEHGSIREYFIPDPGCVFMEPDLSQCQARIVAVLAKNWALLEDFRLYDTTKDKKYDVHIRMACKIFDKSYEYISKEERQIGKFSRHGSNFDLGKHEFMIQLAGNNIMLSEWKCGKILDKVHAEEPSIRQVFHKDIIAHLEKNENILIAPNGRSRQFYEKWGRDLWKEAFAHMPQCIEGDQVKGAAVRIKRRLPFVKFLSESHDSFLMMMDRETVPYVAPIVKEELERPIDFTYCSLSRDYKLVIPCDIMIGDNWKDMRNYDMKEKNV